MERNEAMIINFWGDTYHVKGMLFCLPKREHFDTVAVEMRQDNQ